MKKFVLALTALTALSAHAVQQSPVQQCFSRAQNQEQQAGCYDQAIAAQKKRLTSAYNKLIAHRKGDAQAIDALNQLQKGWIGWRDQTVNFLNSNVAGSGSTLFTVSQEFLLDAVTKQAELLETIRDMEGGE